MKDEKGRVYLGKGETSEKVAAEYQNQSQQVEDLVVGEPSLNSMELFVSSRLNDDFQTVLDELIANKNPLADKVEVVLKAMSDWFIGHADRQKLSQFFADSKLGLSPDLGVTLKREVNAISDQSSIDDIYYFVRRQLNLSIGTLMHVLRLNAAPADRKGEEVYKAMRFFISDSKQKIGYYLSQTEAGSL